MHKIWQAASLPEQHARAEVLPDLQYVEVRVRTTNLDLGKAVQ